MKWSVLIQLTPLLIMLAVAAVIDARTRRIPNWLTFGLLIAGVMRAAALGWSSNVGVIGGVGHSLLGVLAGALIPLVLFALKAVGGGDVKLDGGHRRLDWSSAGHHRDARGESGGAGHRAGPGALRRTADRPVSQHALIASNFAYASEIGIQNVVETGKSCRSISKPLPFAVPALIATVLVALMNTLAWS